MINHRRRFFSGHHLPDDAMRRILLVTTNPETDNQITIGAIRAPDRQSSGRLPSKPPVEIFIRL
jgi:hypothetical protein